METRASSRRGWPPCGGADAPRGGLPIGAVANNARFRKNATENCTQIALGAAVGAVFIVWAFNKISNSRVFNRDFVVGSHTPPPHRYRAERSLRTACGLLTARENVNNPHSSGLVQPRQIILRRESDGPEVRHREFKFERGGKTTHIGLFNAKYGRRHEF